jgi:iron(III) transport system ATP-binding protein
VLRVQELVKSFDAGGPGDGRLVAVDRVSITVERGQLVTLLGPSGCGKTTILRCVAGLERPDSGEIAVGESLLFSSANGVDVPPNARRLGLVFQSYALWPHMTAHETVAFPLEALPRRARPPRDRIRERVERALAVVGLERLNDRSPAQLSGGQQQRLALARALVTEPPVLLMDEPLSNLDAPLREDMRLELKRLQRELGATVLYVTHDQAEALAMSKVVAVMRDGRVEQIGRPRDIYERPRSRFVADFVGRSNLIQAVIDERLSDGGYALSSSHGPLVIARSADELAPGARVLVSIRSEQVRIEPRSAAGGAPNRWTGEVSNRAFRGDSIDHVVAVGGLELRVRTDPSVSIEPGTEVTIALPERACSLIPLGE